MQYGFAMSIRALIVDDEPLGRRAVRRLLARNEAFEVIGECGDGPTAVAAIREQVPDVVLLDIQMPGMSGLEVVREVGEARMPPVVFVTAYDEYAVAAFEEGAVDYVLKPFDDERFDRALRRVQGRLSGRSADAPSPDLGQLLRQLGRLDASYRERFVVRVGQRLQVVEAAQIDWVEAANNHVALHVGEQAHLLRETMASVEEMLDPKRFVRVHRSAIVNIARVRSLETWSQNEYRLLLASGARVTTGRTYRDRIREAFGI
jgi:two-component system, LytTR family, response regulator